MEMLAAMYIVGRSLESLSVRTETFGLIVKIGMTDRIRFINNKRRD